MKKFIGLMLAAILGGLFSVAIVKLTEEKEVFVQKPQNEENADNNSRLASLSATAPELMYDFTRAAKQSVDAVVHVKTKFMNEQTYYSYDPFEEFFYGRGTKEHRRYIPAMGSGSGVIVSADGFIVTNRHVINGAEKVEVTLNNKKTYDAEVLGTDPSTDLALLRIKGGDFPYVPYGNSDDIEVGEWVLAVGNPFNLTSTVTAGIISAKGRNINILPNDPDNGLSAVESFIQTDAAVNPGNSGGALVSAHGELIGINTAIKSNTGSYTGYSFAIPVNIVKKVVDDLLEYGAVQRGFIGVTIRNIDDELAKSEGLDELNGAYVSGLIEDGSAKAAGIEIGDIIIKVGSADVGNVAELQEQVSRFRPGDELTVTLKRDGKEMEVPVMLKNKEGNTSIIKNSNPKVATLLGAQFSPASSEECSKLRIASGLKITELSSGKLMSAGIREGFIIVRVDKRPVRTFEELSQALEDKKGGVLIEGVYPNGQRAYYGFGM